MDKQALIKAIEEYKQKNGQYNGDWQCGFEDGINGVIEIINESQPSIRPEIMEFAIAMENEMARHDAEKGDSWKEMSLDDLMNLFDESLLIWKNMRHSNYPTEISHVIDVAKNAMMIFNKAKGE